MKEKCFKMLSEYREQRCRCHVWWKTVPEVGTGNQKSPFANSREVEQYSGIASWLEEVDRSLCRNGMSVTQVKYGNLEQDALLDAKPVG